MSTKAIREALDALKHWSHHAADVRKAEAAEKELEAIEMAAKIIAGRKLTPEELRQAAELMQAIAKEAP